MKCNAVRTAFCLMFVLLTGCDGLDTGAPAASSVSGTTTLNVSTPNAPTSYTINGNDNPTITVQRGIAYTFNLNASGHPFYIMSVPGTNTANAYSNGVTGNGNQTGQLTFVVPSSAPNTLYYDCSNHASMTGMINVTN